MDHDEERSLSLGTEVSASVPPPSPLTGCYLLAVIGEPHTSEHKEIILQRLIKVKMEVQVTIDRDGVKADVTGELQKTCTGVTDTLGLSKSKIQTALDKLDSAPCEYYYTIGYTKTIVPIDNYIEYGPAELLILATDVLDTAKETSPCNVNLIRIVENAVEVTWSTSEEITRGFDIGIKINSSGLMDFTSTTGIVSTAREIVIVGADCGSKPLRPGKKLKAKLQVIRRALKVHVRYGVHIDGDLPVYKGGDGMHQCRIKDILKALGMPTCRTITQTIFIKCYTEAVVKFSKIN